MSNLQQGQQLLCRIARKTRILEASGAQSWMTSTIAAQNGPQGSYSGSLGCTIFHDVDDFCAELSAGLSFYRFGVRNLQWR